MYKMSSHSIASVDTAGHLPVALRILIIRKSILTNARFYYHAVFGGVALIEGLWG